MKLVYKLSGLTALSGAAITGYLLLPSSPIENNIEDKGPEITEVKPSGAWKKKFEEQGYVSVDMKDAWEIFSGISEAFQKYRGISELGKAGNELRALCNSYEEKDILTSEEDKEAKRWCFKPRAIEDILRGKGRKFIHKVEQGVWTWEDQKLRALAVNYSKNKQEDLKMETDKDNLEKLTIPEANANNINLDSFKKACENVLVTWSFEENLDNKVEKATQWCTEPAAS